MKKSQKLAKKRLNRKLKTDPVFRSRYEYCLKDVMLQFSFAVALNNQEALNGPE